MPSTEKIEFANEQGARLAAALIRPDRKTPIAYALFAHCFTCGKDIAAAARISRTLAAQGFGVLRFDFTGLGSSDGDFANTNFSSNIADLIAAADYLRTHHAAPQLLIGHSLGGAAVLAARSRIAECRALVTIGAPASATHVTNHLQDSLDTIAEQGSATVSIAGREFTIQRQFVDDLQRHEGDAHIAALRCALLVCHAPLDDVVPIDDAGRIFQAARHPKSFLSLDDADHLLSRLADAQYVANTIATWARRYLDATDEARPEVEGGELFVGEGDQKFLREIHSDDHAWLADEPRRLGGSNLGPDPYEHLLAALGACTSMTMRMYASRKDWPVDDINIRLRHERQHREDCEACEDQDRQLDVLTRYIEITGNLDDKQRARLMAIADRCPVHRTLLSPTQIKNVSA